MLIDNGQAGRAAALYSESMPSEGDTLDENDDVFIVVEEMPKMIGGQAALFEALNYPDAARENGTDRTLDFIKEAEKYKSECVKIGLEVDCALDGSALVLEEDRQKLDILLGAVHRFPDNMEMPESKIKSTFIELHKHFLEEDIDILAHPFRIFRRNKIKTPTELFHPLAELLYETGTAVELNFHTNFPAPEFFESCIEKGVKIGFGSDAHYLYEIGNFLPHIEFLKKLGITPKEYPSILY